MRTAVADQVGAARARLADLLWSGLVPVVLALAAARWLFPAPDALADDSPLVPLARFAQEHAVVVGVIAFVLAGALARYWRPYLPGVRREAGAAAPLDSRRLVSTIALVIAAASLAVIGRALVGETYQVSSGSMLPTLSVGDRILVSKLAYRRGQLPRRGEVVVFRRTAQIAQEGPDELVKRVVGLPGDLVSLQEGRLAINGVPVPRCDAGVYPHLVGTDMTLGRLVVEWLDGAPFLTFETPFSRPFAPYRVGSGELFVLGDNRNNSADSRVWNGGRGAGLPITAIEGRVWRQLAARGRDGRADLRTLLRPLGLEVHLPGMNTQPLEDGIKKCLAEAPNASGVP